MFFNISIRFLPVNRLIFSDLLSKLYLQTIPGTNREN